jgi:two-component system capsular synthesis response regulator RcsB
LGGYQASAKRVGFSLHVRRIHLQKSGEIIVNLRVILADDHPFVLLGVRAALEMHAGVTIVGEAVTPGSLIKLLQSTPCDVLVTDLTMPEVSGAVDDGLELVRRIRCAWPLLRIVVMTALTNTEILRAIVSDGVVSTLSKMETTDELWQAIEASGKGEVYVGRSVVEALAKPGDEACDPPPVLPLSRKQAAVIRMFVRGLSIPEIAVALGCHSRTVSRQKREAMAKLGVTNDPGLFAYIRAHGVM